MQILMNFYSCFPQNGVCKNRYPHLHEIFLKGSNDNPVFPDFFLENRLVTFYYFSKSELPRAGLSLQSYH